MGMITWNAGRRIFARNKLRTKPQGFTIQRPTHSAPLDPMFAE
jgi:hypothetical protein